VDVPDKWGTEMKDMIYREDAIDELMHIIPYKRYHNGEYVFLLNKRECLKAIKAIPSADRPQGEWKRRLVDNGFNADWVCSECGYRVKTDFVSFNFCPHCGARMKGADDE